MKFQYLHRDNFRYLTGHGRNMADYVDFVLGQEARFENAHIIVMHDADTGLVSHKVQPYGTAKDEGIKIAGHPARCHMMLSILVKHHGIGESIIVPVAMIINGTRDYSNTYQMYQHYFTSDENGRDIPNGCYTGITKRGWRIRWSEHLRAAKSGSNYLFHRAIREWHQKARVSSHVVIAAGMTEREAMAMEEEVVATDSLYPLGLNMIPGGYAGLAYLRKIGAIGDRDVVTPDARQKAVNRFFEQTSRKGMPNPLAAVHWLDPEYAEKVICSGPGRLTPQQIRDARYLSSIGQNTESIARRIGAKTVEQVKRLIAGATYSRIV